MALVQAGPVRLEVFDQGPRGVERTVVLVHGYRSSGRIWHVVQRELAACGIRSVAVCNRGAGGSDRTEREEDYTPSQFATDLKALADALELDRFALVGHSLGGRTVTRFVQRWPERVRALVLLAAGSLEARPPRTPEGDRELERAAANWRSAINREAVGASWVGLPPEVREALIDDWYNLPRQRLLGPRHDPEALTAVLRAMPVPTLVCCGDADRTVPTEASVRAYLELPPDRRHLHVFHSVGHSPPAEIPERFAGLLRRFLDRALPRRG